jgi:Protein of unknown function (DUF2867)
VRIDPEEYERIELRAHSLLAGVPLHDVWVVDLPGGGPGLTVIDLQAAISVKSLRAVTPTVAFLFRLRGWLGRVFGWDRDRQHPPRDTFASRLTAADREASLVAPGTPDGTRWTLFVSPRESISELQNSTVHAFVVVVMAERPGGYRLYLAIYVRPVGRLTVWYFRLIDPFRRLVIYPAILREIRRVWTRAQGAVP